MGKPTSAREAEKASGFRDEVITFGGMFNIVQLEYIKLKIVLIVTPLPVRSNYISKPSSCESLNIISVRSSSSDAERLCT